MIPPQNIDAEQSVLGSMLINKDTITEVRSIVSPTDFYRDSHGLIFETILQMQDQNTPVDMVTLVEELRRKDGLDLAGGVTYVATLSNITPTSANAKHYAKIVRDKSIGRQIIKTAQSITQSAFDDTADYDEILKEAQQQIFQISTTTKAKGGLTSAYDIAFRLIDEIPSRAKYSGLIGISTGFKKLDLWTAGLQGGQLIIVAARPSMGKTSWTVQVGANAAIRNKKRVAIFSLETTKEKLVEKIIVNQGKINAQNIRLGMLDDRDIKDLVSTANVVSKAPILIDDTPDITVHDMLTKCRKAKLEGGLDMVIIDYIQLIRTTNKKGMTRDREIGEISRALKMMSLELSVPVIALSQLSRTVEQTSDKRPTLSHLRESGSIEADADTVMFLYRPEYYFPNEPEHKGVTEVIVAKQREGPVGTVKVTFLKEFTKFIDVEGSVVRSGV